MPKFTKQEIKPLKPEDCVIFDKCSAPICPLYNKGVWFSDEDICTNEYFQQTRQVKNQKKLKKNKISAPTLATLSPTVIILSNPNAGKYV